MSRFDGGDMTVSTAMERKRILEMWTESHATKTRRLKETQRVKESTPNPSWLGAFVARSGFSSKLLEIWSKTIAIIVRMSKRKLAGGVRMVSERAEINRRR
jgi:hypothetical protein